MKLLLDTNAVIAIVRKDERFLTRLRERSPADFGISSIAAHELFYGAYKSVRIERNLARIENLRFPFVEFDREDARRAGALRAALAITGNPIGPFDVLIAGQALARDLVLITHNIREFARVPGLRFESWEAT